MAEPTVYLEKLSAFARILRMEGLPVSPRDTEDGAAILTQLGFADRETVKTALMTIYAKSREEQLKFSAAFDGFFLSEEAVRAQARERAEQFIVEHSTLTPPPTEPIVQKVESK